MVACLAAGVDAAGVLADAYAIGVKLARDPRRLDRLLGVARGLICGEVGHQALRPSGPGAGR